MCMKSDANVYTNIDFSPTSYKNRTIVCSVSLHLAEMEDGSPLMSVDRGLSNYFLMAVQHVMI